MRPQRPALYARQIRCGRNTAEEDEVVDESPQKALLILDGHWGRTAVFEDTAFLFLVMRKRIAGCRISAAVRLWAGVAP